MTPAGASACEWAHWDLMLGLGADLLPVVCEPNLPIAPGSVLTDYGKVPSRALPSGHVVGFPKWTTHVTTDDELGLWSADPRLGICLQTRLARAIDIDVTDADQVSAILDALRQWFVVDIPVRSRANSTKCLVLYQVPGAIGKSVLPVAHGMIEFLGTGQQCLVAGSHPSGARYEWDGVLPVSLPVLTPAEDAAMKATLEIQFATGPVSHARARRSSAGGVVCGDPGGADRPLDHVAQYLTAHGLVQSSGAEGRLDVVCPWVGDHTPGTGGLTSSSYFPAGTGGYETGAFVCLHAHCASKTIGDFLDAVGYLDEGFDALPEVYTNGFNHATGAMEAVLVLPHPKFERNKMDKIIPHTVNVVAALTRPDLCHLDLRYDTFLDDTIVHPRHPGDRLRRFTNDDYTELLMTLRHYGFGPGDIPEKTLFRSVEKAARTKQYDSAVDWLTSLPPWDGIERVDTFCSTYLQADLNDYTRAVSRYWWTAHAGRVLCAPVQADMAIILQSGQGTGKTSAVKAMVPQPTMYVPLSFHTSDIENARIMSGALIGELAELSGLKGKDAETTKAWISCTSDSVRKLYQDRVYQLPRRLVLVGTTNRDDFAGDETGHRRLLPVVVGDYQDRDAIERDRNQLWAEGLALYRQHGILWKDAQHLARGEHAAFEPTEVGEETIDTWLHTPRGMEFGSCTPLEQEFITLEEVMRDCLRIEPQHFRLETQHRIGRILRKLGLTRCVNRTGPRLKKVWVPPANA